MLALDATDAVARELDTPTHIAPHLRATEKVATTLARAAKACGYQLDKLEAAAKG
jgi:hypothetical protein